MENNLYKVNNRSKVIAGNTPTGKSNTCSLKDRHKAFNSNFINNDHKLETIQIFINTEWINWYNKWTMNTEMKNELLLPTTWITLADTERTEDTECI